MQIGKLKYFLGIFFIIVVVVLVAEGVLFFKTKTEKSSLPVESPVPINRSEIVGIIKALGNEDEFSLENKDGEIIFENKDGDLPEIKYRLSYPGKVVLARWADLKLGDRAVLELSYNNDGQIESRILKIFRD